MRGDEIMKIIIGHGETKRKIDGTFQICGSKEDLLSIAQQISAIADGDESSFSYGWISVHSDCPKILANQTPIGWDE